MTIDELRSGLIRAYERLVRLYEREGGHRFHGFGGYGDDRNYKGPLIWSEGDCQYQLALALEKRFPKMVHLEMPLARYTVHDYDTKLDRRQFIDVVVSDLRGFDPAKDVFARRPHDVFVEVKYVGRSSGRWAFDSRRTLMTGLPADLRKLELNLDRGRCQLAAMLIVDDGATLDQLDPDAVTWSQTVIPLLLSPTRLARRAAARRLRLELRISCPSCGSPRIAPIAYGMPAPELERQADDGHLILGGCELRGDGLDPETGCLDCGAWHPPRLSEPISVHDERDRDHPGAEHAV